MLCNITMILITLGDVAHEGTIAPTVILMVCDHCQLNFTTTSPPLQVTGSLCVWCLCSSWNDVLATNSNGFFFKVLWRSYPGCQAEAAVFCQRLLWRAAHPVSVNHLVHLSGHSHQRHHIWRFTWWCYGKYAGINPQFFLLRFVFPPQAVWKSSFSCKIYSKYLMRVVEHTYSCPIV